MKDKTLPEQGFESLQIRKWFCTLSVFFKIVKTQALAYLFKFIPKTETTYSAYHSNNVPSIKLPNYIMKINNMWENPLLFRSSYTHIIFAIIRIIGGP